MTLSAFNQQYPSTIPIEALALINGVQDGSSGFSTSTLVKRVVAN
jgi:hypothetical protein